MTLQARITLLAQAIGADIKALKTADGSLAALTTTEKTNLVGAINELRTLVNTNGAVINDSLSTGAANTWSITKINSALAASTLALKTELLGGVPATTYDTLKEISDYLAGDATATSGLVTAMGRRVSVDVPGTAFTTAEKLQARTNIDAYGAPEIGNPDTDLLALYVTAKT